MKLLKNPQKFHFYVRKNPMRIAKLLLPFILLLSMVSIGTADDFLDQTYGMEFLKEGLYHFNQQDYEAAIEFFRKSLGKIPENQQARFLLGMAYYKAGFEENAVFEFSTLIESVDDEVERGMLTQFLSYLNMKKFIAQDVKKSNDYAVSLEIQGNNVGKYKISKVTGIDIDDSGNIYVAGFGSKLALKLSPGGKPIHDFSSPRIVPGRLYDIVHDSAGYVYISDFTNDTVYKFTDNGRFIQSIGTSGFRKGQFYGPTGITLDRDGNLYVIDSGNMRVIKFSPDGEFLQSFGREGDHDGEFSHPSGIAVDSIGRIYVSDHGRKRIGIYDASGNFITYLKGIELIDPYGLSFAGENRLVVSDGPSIKIYDTTHSTWTEINTDGKLSRVLDAKIDRIGQLAACDFEEDLILQFVPKEDKYRNLTVILERVDAESYPAIVYYVSVLDADGLPIYGLGQRDFLLRLGEAVVPKIDLSFNEVRDSRLNLLFLVDKSLSMAQYAEDVENLIRSFTSNLSSADEMAVIGFNEGSWIASSFTNSRLRTIDAVIEERYEDGKNFDQAFRRSIDYLNKRYYKKALVVITDGFMDASSFQTFSYQSCINYAANNHIPVFILSFGEWDPARLEYLSRSTGGKYYEVLRSNEVPYLYQTIRAYRSPEYVIFFNDDYDPDLAEMFVESDVEVDFNSRVGRNKLGMVYPKIIQEPVIPIPTEPL